MIEPPIKYYLNDDHFLKNHFDLQIMKFTDKRKFKAVYNLKEAIAAFKNSQKEDPDFETVSEYVIHHYPDWSVSYTYDIFFRKCTISSFRLTIIYFGDF